MPDDVVELIYCHMCACVIQRRLRQFMVRFCRATLWRRLLTALLEAVDTRDLRVLMRSDWVRREWRQEPESWLFMLRSSPADSLAIVEDLDQTTRPRRHSPSVAHEIS